MANITVNQTRSNPSPWITGPTNGRMINVISIQSRKKPSKKVMNRTVMTIPSGLNGKPLRPLPINSSPPNPRNTSENAVAPMNIAKINAVVLVVSLQTSLRILRLSRRLQAARIRVPKAPTPEGVLEILCQFFNVQHNAVRRIDNDRQIRF